MVVYLHASCLYMGLFIQYRNLSAKPWVMLTSRAHSLQYGLVHLLIVNEVVPVVPTLFRATTPYADDWHGITAPIVDEVVMAVHTQPLIIIG